MARRDRYYSDSSLPYRGEIRWCQWWQADSPNPSIFPLLQPVTGIRLGVLQVLYKNDPAHFYRGQHSPATVQHPGQSPSCSSPSPTPLSIFGSRRLDFFFTTGSRWFINSPPSRDSWWQAEDIGAIFNQGPPGPRCCCPLQGPFDQPPLLSPPSPRPKEMSRSMSRLPFLIHSRGASWSHCPLIHEVQVQLYSCSRFHPDPRSHNLRVKYFHQHFWFDDA